MKPQFAKFANQQGNDSSNIPGRIDPTIDWSADNDTVIQQPASSPSSLERPMQRPRSGLLSNWNTAQDSHQAEAQRPGDLVEQDTIEQPTVAQQPQQPGWSASPAANVVNPQAFMNGPISPRESGITPLNTNVPVQQPISPPIYAPGQPVYGPNAGSPQMFMPGYAQAPMQQAGYPGGGGPLPVPPGNGGGGKSGGRPNKKRRYPIWARVVTGFMLFLVLAAGAGFWYYQTNFSKPINDITGQSVQRARGEEDPNQGRNGDILSGSRINILLLGSDTDQKFGTTSGGSTVYLAQTDIVVTIDPATKTVGMLSIPRDFYINIPGYGQGKLDEAFEHGYSLGQGGFAGAVDLSRQTIQDDFGIPINYYAWVGLDGFIKVINTVGGVDVDVLHPITDDSYPNDVGNNTNDIYAYQRLYIPPGPQHLSGPQALEYVRSRHADLVGDFGRSARQQQVLSALKIKLDNPGIVGQLTQIANDLDGYVKTDMQLSDVLKLMNFARTVDANKISRVILGPPYSSSAILPNGTSIVEPNCSQIVPVIAHMFALGNKAACNIAANSSNSMLASERQPSSGQNLQQQDISANALQTSGQLTDTASLLNSGDNMFGFRSLLDLLFGVVFESPQALQI